MADPSVEERARNAVDSVVAEQGMLTDRDQFGEGPGPFLKATTERARAQAVEAGLSDELVWSVVGKTRDLAYRRWSAKTVHNERWELPRSTQAAAPGASSEGPARNVRRINVNFSDQAYQTLEGLARMTGKSMSDVLRDAIALKAWFEQTRAEGGHVLVEYPDAIVREVISI